MGRIVTRTIISNGVMTVLNNPDSVQQNLAEFYQHLDDFYKINAEGQKVIEQNNRILEQLHQYQMHMQAPQHDIITQPLQKISNDNSYWGNFIERGRRGAESAVHPQNQDFANNLLNSDNWAEFIFDIIKKTVWLVWNSFMGISHWLFLLIAIGGIIAYIAGWKKGGVVSICSTVFYILLRLINMAIGG